VDYKLPSSAYAVRHTPAAVTGYAQQRWRAFPNPASDVIYIDMPAGAGNKYVIADITGRQLLSGIIDQGVNPVHIDELSPGTYIIRITNNNTDGGEMVFVKN
jgi:hypothetical protein